MVHFPILVCWTLWRARNNVIFESSRPSSSNIINWITLLFSQYPALETKKKRCSQPRTTPVITYQNIGTFDGVEQGGICGGGGTLTFSDGRVFHFKVGLGAGTNTRAELLSILSLLWATKLLHCDEIQIFGDSMANKYPEYGTSSLVP